MAFNHSVTPGQPFNIIPQNNVASSVSGSWTAFGNAVLQRGVRIQGIYWGSTTAGESLRIRDPLGIIFYDALCIGGSAVLDLFTTPITTYTPFEYLDSEGGNAIIIYGEYV